MPDSAESLLIALLLMPGCFGYFIFARVYNGKISDTFEKAICVVVINVTSIIIYSTFWPLNNLSFKLQNASEFATTIQSGYISLAILSAISIAISILSALAANSKKVSSLALKVGFTLRGHQPAVLTAAIVEHPKAYFKFRFKSGGYVIGHPRLYSLQGEECCIFLEKAARRAPRRDPHSNQPDEYAVEHGILLLNFDDVLCVELL